MGNLEDKARQWVMGNTDFAQKIDPQFYCQTRDVFQARLDKMSLSIKNDLVAAIAGEIGNNSFDHNLGKWTDISGVFFGYDENSVVLADRGQGILTTLKRVKPDLKTDEQALEVAFKERISGRAPENRGNGLKFVLESVAEKKLHLVFFSGTALAVLNNQFIVQGSQPKIQGCLAVLTYEN